MSRIYEALQRAEFERTLRTNDETHSAEKSETEVAPESSSSGLSRPLAENGSKHSWHPVIESIPCLQERSLVVEQFRALRSRLMQARHETPTKTVLVSSGMPSEGKSFSAVNLAVSLARDNMNRVLLIDGDLRRPTLHKILGTASEPGLSEYLDGKADPFEVLQRLDSEDSSVQRTSNPLSNLRFIPSGRCTDNASELAANGRIRDLIASLAPHFDWIFIDSPPILAVTDAVDMARWVDGVLLVAREAHTPFQVLQRAQAAFQQSRILGVVLNAAKHARRKDQYYYSSYYSSYYGDAESSNGDNRTEKGLSQR